MSPHEIHRLLDTAKELQYKSGRSPEAFLLAYVAWEIFRIRILLVGLCANGLTVQSGRIEILNRKIWSDKNYNSVFAEVFGTAPENTPNVGIQFKSAKKLSDLRNRFAHGFSRAKPEVFREAVDSIIRLIESDWETPLRKALLRNGIVAQRTNPLKRLAKNKS